MPRLLANSVVSQGCDYFISFIVIQDSYFSSHFTSNDHPTVVFLALFFTWRVTKYMSVFGKATDSSFW